MANTTKSNEPSTTLKDGEIDPLLEDMPSGAMMASETAEQLEAAKKLGISDSLVTGDFGDDSQELTADNFDEWGDEDENGFPPYWRAGENKCFGGIVIDRDVQIQIVDGEEEEFVRYICIATNPLRCHRGQAKHAEEVLVKPGQRFTVTEYAGLPLQNYMGFQIRAMVSGKIEMTGKREDMWTWKVRVDRALGQQLKVEAATHAAVMREAHLKHARERRMEMQKRLSAIAESRKEEKRKALKAVS